MRLRVRVRLQGVVRSKSSHLLRVLPGAAAAAEEGATEPDQAAPLSPAAALLGCPVRSRYLQKGRLRSVQADNRDTDHKAL